MSRVSLLNKAIERKINRDDFESFEHVSANFVLDKNKVLLAEVVNLNTTGALLKIKKSCIQDVQKGIVCTDLKIFYEASQIGFINKFRVCHVTHESEYIYIGVFFEQSTGISEELGNIKSIQRRKYSRILTKPLNRPTGYFRHPYLYDEKIFFDILDINSSGMKISTSMRNRTLLPGAILNEVSIQIPMGDVLTCSGTIVYSDINSIQSKIVFGVCFKNLSDRFNSEISKYLISFSQSSPSKQLHEIKQAGFKPKYIKSNIQYCFVKSLEDYTKILELRVKAYSMNGKISKDTKPFEMADFYDTNSVLIAAKMQGEIIGSVRLTYCDRPEDKYELDDSIEVPKYLKRDRTVEISRLSVDPDFQSTDIVLGLLERCTQMILQKNYTHIITSCVEEMLGYYAKLGFKKLGVQFELKTLQGIPHHLLLLDAKAIKSARKFNPIYWYYTYSGMVYHLKSLGYQSDSKVFIFKRILINTFLTLLKLKTKINQKRVKLQEKSGLKGTR